MRDSPRAEGHAPRDHPNQPEFADELAAALRPVADAEARRVGLGRFGDDIFHEAFRRCLQLFRESGQRPTQRGGCAAVVRKVANEVMLEWRRAITCDPADLDRFAFGAGARPAPGSRDGPVYFDPVRAPAKGVPRLCRRIMAPARSTRYERRLARAICTAAYLVAPRHGILKEGTYRIFVFAYVSGWSAAEIAEELGTTEGAATQRVEKIARRIESHLVGRIRERDGALFRDPGPTKAHGPASKAEVAREEKSIFVNAPVTVVCVRVMLALAASFPETRGSWEP